VLAILQEYDVMEDCFIDGHGYGEASKISNNQLYAMPELIRQYITLTRKQVENLPRFIEENQYMVEKMTVNFKEKDGVLLWEKEIKERLSKEFPELVIVKGVPTNLEITEAGATKGAAILHLGELLGIKREEIMVCGDSQNDIEMIRSAGLGVAMGNATDEVKAAADYITLTNDEDGVAAVIKQFVLNLKTKDFYFDLPQELIAQDPLKDRAGSRLLVLEKETKKISHRSFRDITEYLSPGDCLVLNNTKVIPARLIGKKEGTGAGIELLLLKRREGDVWETLVKPGKKAKCGTKISFGNGLLLGEIMDVLEEGNRLVKFTYDGIFEEILDKLGQMPLPPYITHKLEDKDRYQTVYAKLEGSAAAPTAGLHFTKELLEKLQNKGVVIAHVTLHVGLGTFRPVKVEDVTKHHMHSEFYQIEPEEAEKINTAKAKGKKVFCVGTTSCRTIESAADKDGIVKPGSGNTDIFIYPGYSFKVLDALITNFHLPESTLLMLVSALAGRKTVLKAYEEAVKERYRFFSFGDAMLIV
jgi:S-adenosylmethionine:tRNA ribosyltransferase-isomerase